MFVKIILTHGDEIPNAAIPDRESKRATFAMMFGQNGWC